MVLPPCSFLRPQKSWDKWHVAYDSASEERKPLVYLCTSQGSQRNRTNKVCVHRERTGSYNYGGWQVQILQSNSRQETQGRDHTAVQIQKQSAGRIPPSFVNVSLLFQSVLQLIIWGPLTSRRQSALPEVHQLKCHSKNILTETCRIMFDHVSGHHDPAK